MARNEYTHPNYLGWQVDWPVFVKRPFTSAGLNYNIADEFKWAESGIAQDKVHQLYASGFIHHNKELEKETKAGDRLVEMSQEQLKTAVTLLNAELKKRTTSTKEFQEKRCRQSTIAEKQRGLIRRFLYSNPWVHEVYYEIRDKILD